MSSYPSGLNAEASEQPPIPNYGYVYSTASPPVPHGDLVYGEPQHGFYLQQAATNPQAVAVTNARPPNSFLAWSVVSLIFFFLPLGIAALVFSLGVNTNLGLGLHAVARRKSNVARSLNIAATVLGVAMWIVLGTMFGLAYKARLTAYSAVYANANAQNYVVG